MQEDFQYAYCSPRDRVSLQRAETQSWLDSTYHPYLLLSGKGFIFAPSHCYIDQKDIFWGLWGGSVQHPSLKQWGYQCRQRNGLPVRYLTHPKH